MKIKTWDYIVIGAGSAGCALVHELAAGQPNATILLLEAGGSDRSPFIRFPAGVGRAVKANDWGYRSQPDPSCNGATEEWTRGRVLGGSSSINSTVFVRGAACDFDRWAAGFSPNTATGWSAEKVLPLFLEMENSDQHGPLRGHSGALHIRTVTRPHAITAAFIAAARACGYPFNEDYNGETQEGISYAQFTQRKGLRCSSADAFLRPLLGKRKNVSLRLNAWVQKIEAANGCAKAVTFLRHGKSYREKAGQIILCAGAINSPQLLMLSGVGDPQELRRHGIDVVVDLPGVGRNLCEHPSLRLLYKSRIPTYNLTEGLRQKLAIAGQFLIGREGPISNIFESIAFLKSDPCEKTPDIQLHFGAVGQLDTRDSYALASYPSVSVVVNKSYPLGRGRIRLASPDAQAAPLIEPQLLGGEADVDTLVQGLLTVRKIMQAPPMERLIEKEIVAGADVDDLAALRAFVRNEAKTTYHPAGTCRMGVGEDAVVGADLRVRGLENLWIADASIMPDLISGNTNGVCMMIGKKLGRQLVARRYQ